MKTRLLARLGLSGAALLAFVAAGAAAGTGSSPSPGGIVTVTYTGIVDDSIDLDGTFGCREEQCTNDPYGGDIFTAVYVFNTSVGDLQNNILLISTTGGSSVAYNGGVPVANNLISDTVTISLPDGTIRGTYSVPVGYYGLLQNSTSGSPYPDPPYTLEADVYDADGNQLLAEVTSSAIPFSINTPFATITGDSGSDAALGFDCTAPYECDGVIYADLDASLTSGSPVPEPSTWAMMALGFAGLGFAGYWTSRRPAASAA